MEGAWGGDGRHETEKGREPGKGGQWEVGDPSG